jgi:hypothetical protein
MSQANNTEAAFVSTSMLQARTPTVSKEGAKGLTPATEILSWLGRIPKIPQLLEGTLTEPPVSVPRAKSTIPQATAEADPQDDPPGTRSGALGFSGVP